MTNAHTPSAGWAYSGTVLSVAVCFALLALFATSAPEASAFTPHVHPSIETVELVPATFQPDTLMSLPTVGIQGGRFGVGVSTTWPAYGVSGTLQMSETLTAEAVLGLFGTLSTLSGRLWYRFDRNEPYDFYGFAAANAYRYRFDQFDPFTGGITKNHETTFGVGGGVGIETSLPKLIGDDDFLPLFLNAELGLALASFEHYSFSAIVFGFGLRYRFGSR